MDKYAFGSGVLDGARLGWTIAREKRRDDESQRRYDDEMAYRRSRDDLAEQRYQDQVDYARGRDQVADTRYQEGVDYQRQRDQVSDKREARDFSLREKLYGAQMRNAEYEIQSKQDEAKRAAALRSNAALQHLLKNGTDDGQLASILNSDPQVQAWLKTRNLGDAQIDELRLNDTGKGQPGVVTFIKGKDKQTGQVRRGVATQNASSDPDDPVQVMPPAALADMGKRYADEAEAAGDPESAHATRTELLRFLEAQGIALGGKAPKEKWGEITNVNGFDGQYGPDGQFHQLKIGRGFGLRGARAYGASRGAGGSSSFTNQIYKQASTEFADDPENGVDNSDIRNMTVSLAQDFDLQSGGALAPGVYVQVAKEASQGLSLSRADAEKRAIAELNQGKFLGSMDGEDEEVQQRLSAIMERDRVQFAERYAGMLESAAGYRSGDPAGEQASMTAAGSGQPAQGDVSLDDAVATMVERARSQGSTLPPERARQYLLQKYPDRFGSAQAVESKPEPAAAPRKWADIEANSLDKRAVRAVKGAAQSTADAAATGVAKLKKYGAREVARNRFDRAMTLGFKPSAQNLLDWLPHLEGPDQEQALALLNELYPDVPVNRQGLRKNDRIGEKGN